MTISKEEKKRKDDLFKLILKKSGMSYSEFLMIMKHNFVASNLDSLTATEKMRYNVKV